MRVIKILFSTLILLIAVCAAAIACLIIFVDPNKMKPVIEKEVMANTGYQLLIKGNLVWSFYPILGVKVEDLTLSEPNHAPFMELHKLTIATELMQLLKGQQKLQGNLSIEDVRLMNIHATNARVNLNWENNILTMQSIRAALYEGELQGIAHGSQLSSIPRWDWDVQLKQVQMKPLLQDLNGGTSKLTLAGLAEVTMQATTQGKSRDQLLNNLNGTTQLNVKNGIVEGIDLNYLIKSADELINKKPVQMPANINKTSFDSFASTFTFKNGLAETNNIMLVSSAFLAKANGNINLVTQAVNLALQVTPQQDLRTQWEVPVLITGNARNPDVRLDTYELQKFLAKQELQKVKTKVTEQIKKHVPGKTGEFLQKLIGN